MAEIFSASEILRSVER